MLAPHVPSFTRDLPSWTPSARPSLYTLRRAEGGRAPVEGGEGMGEEVSLVPDHVRSTTRGSNAHRARCRAGCARRRGARAASPARDGAATSRRGGISAGGDCGALTLGRYAPEAGEVVIYLVQKNADSETAPPMAAQMGSPAREGTDEVRSERASADAVARLA